MGLNNKFKIMTSLPEKGNKFYNTKSNGGYSTCIQGSPTQSGRNVYSNCVGHACSRFNEVYSLLTGHSGMKYPSLNCNAENFIERAKNTYGLQVVNYPVLGGIMVWQKGSTLNGSDGAGHVAFVEDIYDANTIYTSESGYGNSNPFWNSKRSNSNGRWGLSSGYKFRGCIVNPAIGDVHYVAPSPSPTPTPAPTPSTGKFKVGDTVVINGGLYVSSNAANPTGHVTNKTTKITRYVKGARHPYNTTGDLGWMNESDISFVNSTPSTPTERTYTVKSGDTLSGIAKKLGIKDWHTLYNNNKGVIGNNPNLIKPGQVLKY